MLGWGDEYVFKLSKLIHRVQADTAIGKGCLHINLLTSRSREVWEKSLESRGQRQPGGGGGWLVLPSPLPHTCGLGLLLGVP